MAVLKNLAQEQELEALRAELEALREKEALRQSARGLTFKVSQKGAVSVYGLGRWPVTLYQGQWEALLAERDDILAYITANKDRLSTRD